MQKKLYLGYRYIFRHSGLFSVTFTVFLTTIITTVRTPSSSLHLGLLHAPQLLVEDAAEGKNDDGADGVRPKVAVRNGLTDGKVLAEEGEDVKGDHHAVVVRRRAVDAQAVEGDVEDLVEDLLRQLLLKN